MAAPAGRREDEEECIMRREAGCPLLRLADALAEAERWTMGRAVSPAPMR